MKSASEIASRRVVPDAPATIVRFGAGGDIDMIGPPLRRCGCGHRATPLTWDTERRAACAHPQRRVCGSRSCEESRKVGAARWEAALYPCSERHHDERAC